MFALVDANSFYASCETVFRPDLRGKPVVMLSNNDGCVIARSAEAKALQLPMGAPYFKLKDEFRRHKVHVFSSNYALYADMSNRVMTTLEDMAPSVEIYSIDEAFMNLTGDRNCRVLEDYKPQANSDALMRVVDGLNQSGKGKLGFAGQGMQKTWAMKREMLSPAYTTRFSDLPVAR
ncbi:MULTISPECIES: DUF4113 domain-containing protein [Erwiniaceae]|uniref:Y-family DNA polymerase n=1 Tax=Erwiniaceae TaxID=1903409 RepID=UPI00068D5CDB|nr:MULTISPECIES: DUF4113 domain-containing protein [Erwiniaceae]MBK0092855.1 DUF4113 domain-containing protein [Erwinia sp. S59]